MSYEKFVMDLDHCAAMLRMLKGFPTDPEAMGRDAYQEAGPGENFLSTGHTLRHFREANFQPEIPEPGPYEAWIENGSRSLERRANACWKAMLSTYEEPPMDQGVREELDAFVMRRKSEMDDAWY